MRFDQIDDEIDGLIEHTFDEHTFDSKSGAFSTDAHMPGGRERRILRIDSWFV